MTPTAAALPTYDKRRVGWLSLAQLVTWGSVFYTFSLLLEPVEHELALTRAQTSFAFSLALLTEGLCAYPVGRWIDHGHERIVMTAGSLLVGAGLVWHSQVSSLASFYAVWMLLGAGLACTLYSPVFAVVTRRFPNDFRRAIITLTFLGGLASTVFIPVSAWLLRELGWRHALWVLATLHFLLCAPLHAFQLRDAPPRPARDDPHLKPPSAYVRSTPFLFIGVFVVGFMGVTSALPPHMISLLRGMNLDESWVILIPASIGVLQVLGRLMLFFFEHRFDVHAANRWIPVLVPLGLAALIAGAGHGAAAILFVVLYGLGNGMMTIVKGTAIAQYVNRDHVASLNGALGVPTAVSRALAPLVMGLLWTPQDGYRWGLWLLLAASIVSVIALVFAQRHSLLPISSSARAQPAENSSTADEK